MPYINWFTSYFANSATLFCSKSLGSATGAKRWMVLPSLETRNLVKFQRISLSFSTLLLIRLSIACAALALSPLYSSVGACDLRYSKTGLALAPFTSLFAISGKVTPWLRRQNSSICSSLPGSWLANWSQGKPRITNPWSFYFL